MVVFVFLFFHVFFVCFSFLGGGVVFFSEKNDKAKHKWDRFLTFGGTKATRGRKGVEGVGLFYICFKYWSRQEVFLTWVCCMLQ